MLVDMPLSMQLIELIPKGQITLASIDPQGKSSSVPCKSFSMPEEVAQAEAWALKANSSGKNCYFQTNIGKSSNKRHTKADVVAARFLWADIDPDIQTHGSYGAARSHLLGLVPALSKHASLIIDSGNGIQVFYKLSPEVDIADQKSKDEYEALNKAIAKMFNADSTQDCSRILRLPGTQNYPSPAKVAKGYPAKSSSAKIAHHSDLTYTLDSIKEALRISPEMIEQASVEIRSRNQPAQYRPPMKHVEITEALRARFDLFLEGNPAAKARHLGNTDGLNDKSGSGMDMSMATSMMRGGFNIEQIKALLENWAYGSKNNDRSQDRYWANIQQNSYARDEEITQEKGDAFLAQISGNPPRNPLNPKAEEGSPDQITPPTPIDLVNESYAWDCFTREIYDIKNGLYVPAPKFCMHYDNVPYKPENESRGTTLGRAWLKSPRRRNVTRLVLAPNKPAVLADGSLNIWQGYTTEPIKGDVTPFLNLIGFVLPNEFERNYCLKWLAKMIQDPGTKFLVSLVVWSIEEGVGKGLLFETVGSLFNQKHFKVVGNEVFNDQFTEWQSQKVFIIADEVSSADKRSTADRIKGWITATENNINVKNTAKFSETNLIKYVFLSNHPDAVYLNNKDRRFFVAEGPDKKLPDEIKIPFIQWLADGGRAILLDYLLKLDTASFDPTAPAPMSQSKLSMMESNKSDLEQWVENILLKASADGRDLISTEELAAAYNIGSKPARASGKTVATILKRMQYKKLDRKARLQDGTRRGLFTPAILHSKYNPMSETQLGNYYAQFRPLTAQLLI